MDFRAGSLHTLDYRFRDWRLVVSWSQTWPAHIGDYDGRIWDRSYAGSFFPMHLPGATGSFTDTMHIVSTIALVILIFLFVAFGATAAGNWFRYYSIGPILTLLVFGALAGMQGPRFAANLATPWLGITERVDVYSAMLWVLVLGVVLLREQKHSSIEITAHRHGLPVES